MVQDESAKFLLGKLEVLGAAINAAVAANDACASTGALSMGVADKLQELKERRESILVQLGEFHLDKE